MLNKTLLSLKWHELALFILLGVVGATAMVIVYFGMCYRDTLLKEAAHGNK